MIYLNANIYSEKCIASIRRHLDKSGHKYITYPKFIFLCGKGFNSQEEYTLSNRGIVDGFIRRLLPDTHIVLSEQMFKYFGTGIERERNRIICRKYRYGEHI